MPTTTMTAPPRARTNAEIFGARLDTAGWDVEIRDDDWSRTIPPRVRWSVRARKGVDLITFSWSTVTGQGSPRTTKYLGGTLRRPLAAAKRDQVVSLRTIGGLNTVIQQLTAQDIAG
jgi:hypothetical protein